MARSILFQLFDGIEAGKLRDWGEDEEFNESFVAAAKEVYKARIRKFALGPKLRKTFVGACGGRHNSNEGVNGIWAGHLLDICHGRCRKKQRLIAPPEPMLSNLVSDIEAINFFARRFKKQEKLRNKRSNPSTRAVRRMKSLPRSSPQRASQATQDNSTSPVNVNRRPPPSFSFSPATTHTQFEATASSDADSNEYYTANSRPPTSSDPLDLSSDDVREPSDLNTFTTVSSIPRKRKGPKPCVPFQLDPDPVDFKSRRSNLVLGEDDMLMPALEDSDEEFPESIINTDQHEDEVTISRMIHTPDQSNKRTFKSEPSNKRKKVERTAIAVEAIELKKMPSLYSQIEKRNGEGSKTKEAMVSVRAKKIVYREIIEILDSP